MTRSQIKLMELSHSLTCPGSWISSLDFPNPGKFSRISSLNVTKTLDLNPGSQKISSFALDLDRNPGPFSIPWISTRRCWMKLWMTTVLLCLVFIVYRLYLHAACLHSSRLLTILTHIFLLIFQCTRRRHSFQRPPA